MSYSQLLKCRKQEIGLTHQKVTRRSHDVACGKPVVHELYRAQQGLLPGRKDVRQFLKSHEILDQGLEEHQRRALVLEHLADVVDSAVQHGRLRNKAFRRNHADKRSVVRIRAHDAVHERHVAAGGISHHEDVAEVKAVLSGMAQHKSHHGIRILHACGEYVLGCEPVAVVDHGKAPPGERHAVVLIDIFVPVHPASAMDIDYHRQGSSGITGTVYIEQVPDRIRTVADVIVTYDIFRRGLACILSSVRELKRLHEHPGYIRHTGSISVVQNSSHCPFSGIIRFPVYVSLSNLSFSVFLGSWNGIFRS